QALEEKRLVRRDRVLAAGDRRDLRPPAGRNQDVLRGVRPAPELHRVRVTHGRAAEVDRRTGVAQGLLVDAVEPRDLAVLVRKQRRPVEARFAGGPAEALGDLEILAEMRGVRKELLRDAADVDASAAEAVVFRDRD